MMKTLLLDGAQGTILMQKGFSAPFEDLNITHPLIIQSIHQSYLDAGSKILLTHTFNAQTQEQCEAAWNNIKNFDALKFASIGPEANAELIVGFFGDKVEKFVFETIYQLEAAKKLIEKFHHLDPIFSFSLKPDDFKNVIHFMNRFELSTIGLNCLDGFSQIQELLKLIPAKYQIYLKPNTGLSPLTAEEFAQQMAILLKDYPLSFIGGCCGTDPSYICQVSRILS